MSDPDVFVRTLGEMEAERARLATRAGHLDTAIGALRNLLDLPLQAAPRAIVDAPAQPAPARRASRIEKVEARGTDLGDALLAALRQGPMKPGDLATAVGAERANARYHIKQLEARGLVVSTGVTASRRVALVPVTAKEAP